MVNFFKFLFALFLLTPPSQADDSPFFQLIQNKPKAQQVKLLKKRISLTLQSDINVELKASLKKLMAVESDTSQVLSFLDEEFSKSKQVGKVKEIGKMVAKDCVEVDCNKNLQGWLDIKSPLFKEAFVTQLVESYNFHIFNLIRSPKSVYLDLLKQYKVFRPKEISTLLVWLLEFGFVKETKALIEESKLFEKENSKWLHFKICKYYLIAENFKEARTCFDKFKRDPWFDSQLLFLGYLENLKMEKASFDIISKKLADEKNDGIISVVVKIMKFQEVNEVSVQRLSKKDLFSDYESGFWALMINEKFNIFSDKQRAVYKKQYFDRFSGSTLELYLNKKINRDMLEKTFGKLSIHAQLASAFGMK
jgi:hypothetical protein